MSARIHGAVLLAFYRLPATVNNLNYQLASGSLGFKYRGAFLQGDYYSVG